MIYLKNSFLGYNHPVEKADACVIGIPFDSTSLNPGSRFGPIAIREALKVIEGYDSELGFDIFERIKICDLGDIEVVPGSYELTAERIKDTINSVKEKNPEIFFLFFGGEHLTSLPLIETIKPDTVLDFDAHADLRADMMGAKFSHATWAHHIYREFNLVQKGVRSFSSDEAILMKELKGKISGSVHLTVDIDVFDPSIAPDTGLPEMNGWNFTDFCENLNGVENLTSSDIVEVAPKFFDSITAVLAANVVKRILIHKFYHESYG